MGQQPSRRTATECNCGCAGWDRSGRITESTSSVHRYMNALTDRWTSSGTNRQCSCRRRRWRRPACVCTAYRPLSDARDERLAAVLTLGARDLRRELDAIVINADDNSDWRDNFEPPTEIFVLSVTPRTDGETSQDGRRNDLTQQNDRSIRLRAPLHMVYDVRVEGTALLSLRKGWQQITKVHTQVDYKHCLVPDLQEITACSFYWGKMDRYEAEKLLDNKPEGTFLLRDSAQEEHLFSVSFRKYGRSLHARIEHFQHRFSFDCHDPAVYAADTVTKLIEHYKDPACVMFFEPQLTAPLPRTEPFSLQQLTRAAIVSHITYDDVELLPLPTRLRAYLKEYHYRQRVRVRRLEPGMDDPTHSIMGFPLD